MSLSTPNPEPEVRHGAFRCLECRKQRRVSGRLVRGEFVPTRGKFVVCYDCGARMRCMGVLRVGEPAQ